MLPPYGCDWVQAPNFQRLAQSTVVFDNCYVGSMPCMPARRELHAGRYNFLHRSWGPIEPFDDSMPEILSKNGIYTHLVTDHQHYWEDGGCTYHTRYDSFELVRGQEGDPFKGDVMDPIIPEFLGGNELNRIVRQDWVNRKYIQKEVQLPIAKTFEKGIEFIHTNHNEDNWFLQIETFDPHEPFYTPQNYKSIYPHNYQGKHFDWPPYAPVTESSEEVQHVRYEYAALVSMCDKYLGKVLDVMDSLKLWDDTLLIVNTDHGFLLGEHDWWAKCVQPFYNEVAHIPLFIWDPRSKLKNVRRESLVQTIDLAPTLLDFFNVDVSTDMQGKSLKDTIALDKHIREAALFGIHGGHVNCTDGRYVYMRGPSTKENKPLYNYTVMPTHMRSRFGIQELKGAELSKPFSFTKGVGVLKVSGTGAHRPHNLDTMLFDLNEDPQQINPIYNDEIERYMVNHMVRLMKETDAPEEQYERLGLVKPL